MFAVFFFVRCMSKMRRELKIRVVPFKAIKESKKKVQ
jgi:hypothetical protein